jgi:hypothetical protein
MTQPTVSAESELVRRLFPRIHAVALGLAVAVTMALAVFLMTVLHLLADPEVPIWILRSYFLGYSRSWAGAFVGAFWGALTGFITGWLLAVVHNVTIEAWVLLVRARADLSRTRSFLDQVR